MSEDRLDCGHMVDEYGVEFTFVKYGLVIEILGCLKCWWKRIKIRRPSEINDYVSILRFLSGGLEKLSEERRIRLFPGTKTVDYTGDPAYLLGGDNPDSGNKIDLAKLIRYIADLMEK